MGDDKRNIKEICEKIEILFKIYELFKLQYTKQTLI